MDANTIPRNRHLRLFVGLAVAIAFFGGFTAIADARKCLKDPEVALIFDDSGSMEDTDPFGIRAEALRLFLNKPSTQGMKVGAVEFGDYGGPLFIPGVVSEDRKRMMNSLWKLDNEGYTGRKGELTRYNAAFRASRRLQPNADARIFLTDGVSTDRRVRIGLAKGAPNYVIGLNIGEARKGKYARQLRRIAQISGGRYFPLRKGRRFNAVRQMTLLQPVINRIASRLGCGRIAKTNNFSAKRKGQRFGPYGVRFGRQQTIQVQASWARPGTRISFVNCRVVTRNGRTVADLKGSRGRSELEVRVSTHRANKLLVVKRPQRGWKFVFNIKVVKIKRPTKVVVQVEKGGGGNAFKPGTGGGGTTTPPPPASKVITVDNRVTNGLSMREDPTPARLTTKPWTFCTTRGCNIYGTERTTGQTYDKAVCQAWGERTTNGNDHSSIDDANPALFESSRYYGVRLGDGTFGYVSEVWIAAQDRGGLWLPLC